MILSALLLRNTLKILLTCVTLFACNLIDKTSHLFQDDSWVDLTCDTSLHASELKIYTLVQPFYLADTLLKQDLKPRKIFIAFVDTLGKIQSVGLQSAGEEASQIINISSYSTLNITWQEQAYLWALVKQPNYLYNRWENLLVEERKTFLSKRDSILSIMKEKHSSIKITSDLRSTSHQLRYLGANKTATPVSMHNFGLAADFAIYTRRRRISNNLSFYRPLDSLTSNFGLTWGGNFIGFVDVGHIQLFKNGADLLRKYPDLAFEFEPYRIQYNAWMTKMITLGKEEKAGDTKELLQELNKLKKNQACQCLSKPINPPTTLIENIQKKLANLDDYQSQSDILLVGDLSSQTATLITSKSKIAYPLGVWK